MKKLFLTSNRAAFLYKKGNDLEKREVLEEVLSNISLQDGKIASIQLKHHYHTLFMGPKITSFSTMLRIVDDVRTIIQRQNEYLYIPNLNIQ